MSEYPEHDKLKALAGKNDVIAGFLEWMQRRGFILAKYWGDGLEPVYYHHPELQHIPGILAAYFGIDQNKLEDEKWEMIDALRAMNERQKEPQ